MMTSGASGAAAITSELLQALDPGVCSLRAQQTVCILPPKQNMAIWGELTAGLLLHWHKEYSELLCLQQLPFVTLKPHQ